MTDRDSPFPLFRPAPLAAAAARRARHYRRGRDLPAALAGAGGDACAGRLARLARTEAAMEAARREGRPGYRASRHVTVLAALLAEGAGSAAGREARPGAEPAHPSEGAQGPWSSRARARAQPKASGSAALRSAMKDLSASSTPGSRAGAS